MAGEGERGRGGRNMSGGKKEGAWWRRGMGREAKANKYANAQRRRRRRYERSEALAWRVLRLTKRMGSTRPNLVRAEGGVKRSRNLWRVSARTPHRGEDERRNYGDASQKSRLRSTTNLAARKGLLRVGQRFRKLHSEGHATCCPTLMATLTWLLIDRVGRKILFCVSWSRRYF